MVNLELIKELRKRHEVTGQRLADLLDITILAYFNKEGGRRKFKVEELYKLSRLYNCTVDDLLIKE